MHNLGVFVFFEIFHRLNDKYETKFPSVDY